MCSLDILCCKSFKVADGIPRWKEDWLEKSAVAKDIIIKYLTDNFLHFADGDRSPKQISKKLDEI